MPQLLEQTFHRSVVIMLEHNEDGALGLVINHETDHFCSEVADSFQLAWPTGDHLHLRRGGPVESQSLWMLHDDGWFFEETTLVAPGIAASRSREALTRMFEADERRLRLLVGYAGWGPGQLEEEIASGSWLTSDAHSDMLFEWAAEDVWERSLRAMGVDPAFLVDGGAGVQ